MERSIVISKNSLQDRSWFKYRLKMQNNIEFYIMRDWNIIYNHTKQPSHVYLRRAEHRSGPDEMIFEKCDDALVQLIEDTIYDFEIECGYVLDEFPMDIIKIFDKEDSIAGGVIYLQSKDGDQGSDFLLNFKFIKIALDNDLIKDIKLKEKVKKLYSWYEKYEQIKTENHHGTIKRYKDEIALLSENARKRTVYNGQVKRAKGELPYDEYIYWLCALKEGDIFGILNPEKNGKYKNKFEIINVQYYPRQKFPVGSEHCTLINIKGIDDENSKIYECNFPQTSWGGDSNLRYVM